MDENRNSTNPIEGNVSSCDDSEDVVFRSNRDSVRQSRKSKTERTPTAVVSEMFAFLSNPSMSLDNMEGDDRDGCQGNPFPGRCKEELNGRESEANTDINFCTPNRKEQDSGFASLERHINADYRNIPDDFLVRVGGDDNVARDRAERLNKHANHRTHANCWVDAGSIDPSLLAAGRSCDNDLEYDDLDLTDLNLCQRDVGCGFKSKPIENGSVNLAQDSSNDTTALLNLESNESYNATGTALPTRAQPSQGSLVKEEKLHAATSSHSAKATSPKKSLDNKFITVDFSKAAKVNDVSSADESDQRASEEGTRYSSLIDSYYDFISDGEELLNGKLDLVSSDDEDDDSVCAPSASAGQSEQDYDSINIPLPQEDLAHQPVLNVNQGCTNEANGTDQTVMDVNQGCTNEANGNIFPVLKQDQETVSVTPVLRRAKLEKNPSVELASDDSSDEDIGIYAESFRRSHWVRVSQEGKLSLQTSDRSSSSQYSSLTSNSSIASISEVMEMPEILSPKADDVFVDPLSQQARSKFHKRSDSTTTTTSEKEFKRHYVSRRKCLIQRADSQQEYHRLSARVYDQDKLVLIEREKETEDLGLHLLNCHPAYITSIDPGSPAAKAGLTEGQILVSVNDENVLMMDHVEIIQLIQNSKGNIHLGVANSDFQPVRDLQAPVMSGYMLKLGNSSFMKIWKKRYFLLRQDNCLYYYKNEHDTDPLGALPLCGYTISRHTDTNRDFCFKAEKYGARTYYFMTENRDQLTEWVGALTEAAARSKMRKESFLSVSSHNVSLPALDIRRPECTGFLGKLSPSRRHWRRRYCVLKDACVYYYKDMNSLSALGVAHLHGYKVDVEGLSRRKYSFSLQPPDQKMRVFIFSSDNETDKKRWVESLIHSIQRWVLADADC